MEVLNYLRKMDWILIITSLLLAGFGLLSIYSSSLSKSDFSNFQKQVLFLVAGFFLMLFLSFFDHRILRNDPYLILLFYFISLASLVGLFFLAPEIRGVKSWYKIGSFSLDPIEMTKIVLVILLAKYFSMRHIEMYRIRHIFLSGIYVVIPSILIFFQPNLGSVLILIFLWISTLLISGIKTRHFFILCLLFIVLFTLSWTFLLKDYQKDRVLTFVRVKLEPLGSGWSQAQAKIAIGSGGIFGQGLGKGPQTQYGFLTEPQTDFIFAAIAEEFGFLGISVLFSLFLILIWRIIKIGLASQTNFPRLFASGFAVLLVSQIFINIGMNLGLLPIIGIPLPLVSYGGSNLIMVLVGISVLENIKVNS